MGDMADYYIEKGLDRGWSPVKQNHFRRDTFTPRTLKTLVCKHCGAKDLKWRADGGKWVMVENTRVHPGNYKPEHICPTAKDLLEGFDG